jgi:hypothetical protein
MTDDETERLPPLLAGGGLVVSLIVGMLIPVYTDEIGWRFQERAAIDGGLDIMFNDACGPNTIAHAPWFMMPVRWFSALANQMLANPLFVRGAGVLCALVWVALLYMLIGRLAHDAGQRRRLRALALSLLGIGILPFLLVLSRPEQPIILTMTAILLITFARGPSPDSSVRAWLKVAAIVGLATIALSYHLKAELYALVACACLIVCTHGRGTLVPRLGGLFTLAALTMASAHYWVERFKCPDDPKLAAMYARENIAAVLAEHGNAFQMASQVVNGANPLNYVLLATPSGSPMSEWLPTGLFTPTISLVFMIVLLFTWTAAVVIAAIALVGFFRSERLQALAEPRVPVSLSILGIIVIWGSSQLNKNVYEAAHILPMLAIFVMLCLSLPMKSWFPDRGSRLLAKVGVPLALISEIIVLASTVGPLLKAEQNPGYVRGQPFSVAIWGYAGIRRNIADAMQASGIPTDRRLHRVLVDELSYLALQKTQMPLHRLGVFSVWNSETDPVEYLRSRDSDGVVVGCHFLLQELRSVASRSGEICAISRQSLDRLAASRCEKATFQIGGPKPL